MGLGFMGLGIRVYGLRVQGLGFMGLGLRVWALGSMILQVAAAGRTFGIFGPAHSSERTSMLLLRAAVVADVRSVGVFIAP